MRKWLYDPTMTVSDLSFLTEDLQREARCDPNGEVSWPISQASAAIEALADSGRLVLGLDIRDYQSDGTFLEVPWSSYTGSEGVPDESGPFKGPAGDP